MSDYTDAGQGQASDSERYRTTIYLTEEELAILDTKRTQMRRAERRRVDRSELIRRAIHQAYGGDAEGEAR